MGRVWFAKGGRSGWWRRLSLDLPCPTLVTMPNHAGTSLCHPAEVRALSVKEYQLIKEFQNEWACCGTLSKQYAQIGNAVPVRLGEIAGRVVAETMDDLAKNDWKRSSQRAEKYRIIYVQSHVRTRQWYKDGQSVTWQDGVLNDHAEYAAPKTRRKTKVLE